MSERYGVIYKATNLTNKKSYIGQTTRTLEKRKKQHYQNENDNCYFHRALRKYSKENWIWEQIDVANDEKELNKLEKYWIKYYDTFNNKAKGYNSTSGGDNFKLSEEVKLKISIANTGNKHTEETKLKISKKTKLAMQSEVIRKKISVSNKNKIISEETKLKISEKNKGNKNGFYNKTHSKEARLKISIANTGNKHTEETKLKISEKTKGEKNGFYNKTHSKEARKKISDGNKNKFISFETRKKLSEQGKNRKHTKEAKLKISVNNSQSKKIICINTNKVYRSISEIIKELNISRHLILRVCNNELPHVNNFIFKFYEGEK